MPEVMSNPKSESVRRLAQLQRKKERLARKRFLVEGPQAVREALAWAPQHVQAVYASTGNESWQADIDRLCDEHGVRLLRATAEVIAALSEAQHPQGVVAVCGTGVLCDAVELPKLLQGAQLVSILHEVRDPGNAGAVIRAADAAGADAVIITGESVDVLSPKVVRSTTGSLFHLPVLQGIGLADAASACRAAGLRVLAADVRGDELAVGDKRLAGRTAWLFGNEARGLRAKERELADASIRLPIFGKAESLNLATAASVLLYQSALAQHA